MSLSTIRTTLNYSTSLSPLTSSYSRVPQFLSWHSINFLYFVFLHLFKSFYNYYYWLSYRELGCIFKFKLTWSAISSAHHKMKNPTHFLWILITDLTEKYPNLHHLILTSSVFSWFKVIMSSSSSSLFQQSSLAYWRVTCIFLWLAKARKRI